MDYQECLDACISQCLSHNLADARQNIATYSAYPVPTPDQWQDVQRRVMRWGDVESPFDCMGQYEMLLEDQGIQTVLSDYVASLKQTLSSIACELGVPAEYHDDLFMLY